MKGIQKIYYNIKHSNDITTTLNTELMEIFHMLLKGERIQYMYVKHYNPSSLTDKIRMYFYTKLFDTVFVNNQINIDHPKLERMQKKHLFSSFGFFNYDTLSYLRNPGKYNTTFDIIECKRFIEYRANITYELKRDILLMDRNGRYIEDYETKQELYLTLKRSGYDLLYIQDFETIEDLINVMSKVKTVILADTCLLDFCVFTHDNAVICKLYCIENKKISRYETLCDQLKKMIMYYEVDECFTNQNGDIVYGILYKRLLKYINNYLITEHNG